MCAEKSSFFAGFQQERSYARGIRSKGMNNYKEYLNSEHWKSFSRKVKSERRYCQNCCKKHNLNVHHKNYECLGKETDKDVIILCGDCHFRFHKKPKWVKQMALRKELDFTRAISPNKPFYTRGGDKIKCSRCSEMHPTFVKTLSNNERRLAIACPNSKPRTQFIRKIATI